MGVCHIIVAITCAVLTVAVVALCITPWKKIGVYFLARIPVHEDTHLERFTFQTVTDGDIRDVLLHLRNERFDDAVVKFRSIDKNAPAIGAMWITDASTAVVVFRGAHGPNEMLHSTDTTLASGIVHDPAVKTHRGFLKCLRFIYPDLFAAVRQRRITRLVLGGFSIGAAMAQMTAVRLFDMEDFNIERMTAVCLGSPRVGNQSYAKLTERFKLVLIANIEDGVPLTPLCMQGYASPYRADVYVFREPCKHERDSHWISTYLRAAENDELTLITHQSNADSQTLRRPRASYVEPLAMS